MNTEPEQPEQEYIPLNPPKTPNFFLHGADNFGEMKTGTVYNSVTYDRGLVDIDNKPIKAKKPRKKK